MPSQTELDIQQKIDAARLSNSRAALLVSACAYLPSTVVESTKTHLTNPGLLPAWLGHGRMDMVQRPLSDFWHPDDVAQSKSIAELPGRTYVSVFVNRLVDWSGEYQPLLWIPEHWESGVVIYRVYLGADLRNGARKIMLDEFAARKQLGPNPTMHQGTVIAPQTIRLLETTAQSMLSRVSRMEAAIRRSMNV